MQEQSFGYWLKHRRKALDLTQAELADQVGCSTVAIRKIEAEERRASAQIVERLAEIFDIPAGERASFLRFARGDWKSAPIVQSEEAPWRVSSTTPRSSLPTPLTSFIGREQELREIANLLSSCRLLTLTGPGGVGKTRLAIQTAHDSIKKFNDGVFWVSLVSLSDGRLIPQEIAQSLNLREASDEPLIETLKIFLETKDVLLVIDNCEHLIRAFAEYAEQLLAACPKLRILATSTEGLGLFHELVWQVPSLSLPKKQEQLSLMDSKKFASIELFDARANTAKPGFALDERNVSTVSLICRRLDGIPLAIELAAARVKVLSIDEIAARLDDCFSLLTTGSRTAIPRHQTLRATIDWSYDLLTEAERILFSRLSVFVGGFTLAAAEAVCSQGMPRKDILDLLGRLVDKSLVIVEIGSGTSVTRYRLLEPLRQYALERLVIEGEEESIRDQQSEFFLKLVEAIEPYVFGRDSAVWFRQLINELDNIRAAIEWSTHRGKGVIALRILGALVNFWFVYGPLSEWHNRVRQVLSLPEGQERTTARSKVLSGISFLYWVDNYPLDVRPELEEALAIASEHGDHRNIAWALYNLGLLASVHGTYTKARSYLEQALKIWREMVPVEKMEIGRTLMGLGDAALTYHEMEQARSFYEEAVTVWRDFGDLNLLAYSIRRLGQLACREDNYEKAAGLFKESLILNQEGADRRGMLACLVSFSTLARAQEDFQRAAVLAAAVESQLASTGTRLLPVDKMDLEASFTMLRVQIEEKTIDKFWAKGKMLRLEQAIAYALQDASG